MAFAITVALTGSAQAVSIPSVITFDDPSEEAAQVLTEIDESARIEDGVLVMTGPELGEWSNYVFSFGSETKRAVSVDVATDFSPEAAEELNSGGGIVIRRAKGGGTTRFFYAISNAEGRIVVGSYRNGLGGSTSSSVDALTDRPGAPVRLAAIEDGSGISVYANGTRVAKLSDSGIDGRDIGLITFGGGEVRFDNVVLNTRGDMTPDELPPLAETLGTARMPAPMERPDDSAEADLASNTFDFDDSGSIFNDAEAEETPPAENSGSPEDQSDAAMMVEGAEGFAKIVGLERSCPLLNAGWADQLIGIVKPADGEVNAIDARRLAMMRTPKFNEAFEAALAAQPEHLPWAACLDLIEATDGKVVDAPR